MDPKKGGYAYEEISFKSFDDTVLYGWFFKSKSNPPKGTVIQFHGNAQNITSHFASLVWLTDAGFDFFTFDYRGFGKSKGTPTQSRVYGDSLAALDEVHRLKELRHSPKILVYAQSLGGAILMRTLPDWQNRNDVTAVILDSTFSSYQAIASQKLRQFWLSYLFSPLAYLLVSDAYAPRLQDLNFKIAVVHDEKDPVVPFSNGEEISRGVQSQDVKFWTFSRGTHTAFPLIRDENQEEIVKFFEGS